jgi:hypothetical protein
MALAAWIHPSVGLQVSLWLVAAWAAMLVLPDEELRGGGRGSAILGLALLGLALAPSLARLPGQSRRLMEGLDPEAFYTLSARVQSPQHMLPHLWRMPQWLAAASYLVLGALALSTWRRWGPERRRLAVLLGTNLVGLAAAWFAVEVLHDVRATIFQPFRMATPARGLCLVLLSGYLVSLWRGGGAWRRSRAAILAVGLTGDWSLVVALAVELASCLGTIVGPRIARGLGAASLALGLIFLARHDTEAGHLRLAGALAFGVLAGFWPGLFRLPLGRARLIRLGVAAWVLPLAALIVPGVMPREMPTWVQGLVAHCRFLERPIDEAERLAVWSRDHLPPDARFVGPPGPKTFRLWSRREVAFNRAASPYHAEGLDDWARRFQDHVGFEGTRAEFARAYLRDRQALERGFEALSPEALADLAARQGAGYVLAASRHAEEPGTRLELLRRDGDLAIYRVREPRPADELTSRRP